MARIDVAVLGADGQITRLTGFLPEGSPPVIIAPSDRGSDPEERGRKGR